eukprot:TRINITY_DN1889_c0_g1_i1.p1 TRINITY_DN1889_c0_g1~~TRINITY_DN1889_c0_g1_i1.p1  ORF type:complete len:859 (-),score=194.15 TRINITY_DN1889_c0_g1_i1:605-3181(-)
MAISKKDQAAIDKYLLKWRGEDMVNKESNHFQCPLVQEAIKKKKAVLLGKILVLGTYRAFIFDKEKDDDSDKKKKTPIGFPTQKSSSDVLEIPYFDMKCLEHSKSKFMLRIKTTTGKTSQQSFRTDSTPTIVEKICLLRRNVAGAAPPLKLIGPTIKFSQELEPFVAETPTSHYLQTYPAWCNYYSVQPNYHVPHWVKYLEAQKTRDLDLTTAIGFETSSDNTSCLGPLILSLVHDIYFKSIIVHNIQRKEILEEVAEVIRNNRVLTKLVLVNVDGDASGFQQLGMALFDNTADTIRIIDFNQNRIGTGMDTINKAFGRWKSPLPYLNLANCNIPAKQLSDLFNALKTNDNISLSLEYLNVSHNRFDDETSTALGNWGHKYAAKSKLRHLLLAGTNFNFNSIVYLKLLPQLHELDLSDIKIDSQLQLQCLYHFLDINPSIVKLHLSNCGFGQVPVLKESSDFVLLLWTKSETLKNIHLNLSNNVPIGAMAAVSLVGAVNLTRLDYSGILVKENQFLDIVKALQALPNLQAAKLDNMLTTRLNMNEIGTLLGTFILTAPSLTELSVAQGYGKITVIAMLETIYEKNERLTYLDISNNQLSDQGIEKLAKFLVADKILKYVNIDSNGVGLNGLQSLHTSLYYNKTLEYIYWSTADIESLIKGSKLNMKEYLYSLLMEIQMRLQRGDAIKEPLKFSNLSFHDMSALPPTPGADQPWLLSDLPTYEAMNIVVDENNVIGGLEQSEMGPEKGGEVSESDDTKKVGGATGSPAAQSKLNLVEEGDETLMTEKQASNSGGVPSETKKDFDDNSFANEANSEGEDSIAQSKPSSKVGKLSLSKEEVSARFFRKNPVYVGDYHYFAG